MAGIYSQGGSAGHRYAGWLSEMEAKNFQFGGKVFNGSPSAIYVGSNLVWTYWLKHATWEAILGAFGQTDGTAVIKATNAYLNQLAASGQAGKDKATALAGFINEDPMMVCSLGLEPQGVTMPIRWLVGDGAGSTGAYILTNYKPTNATTIDTMFELGSTSNNYCGIFSGDTNYGHVDCFYWSNVFYYFNDRSYRVAMGNTYRLVDEGGSQKMYKNGTLDATWTISKGTFTSNTPIALFCLNRNNSISYRGPHKFAWFKVDNVLNLVPYKHPTQGNGMLDLVNAVFYPNAGTGQFTIPDISYTPSTP